MLSVCCMTNDPTPRVTAALNVLREVAGEIVVAVDSAVDHSTVAALDAVADQVFRFEGRPPVDRPRAWLASRCHGDWIFWIDSDEVPSRALVEALPALATARDVLQYHFPRRWLFPDAAHWLDENPWWPDSQIRLLRNDAATMRYGGTHEPFVPMMPWRYVEPAIYHLACLVTSVADRRAKAKLYDHDWPGRISPGGGPFNDVLQIPEQYARRPPVAVPLEDREWIDRALADDAFATTAAGSSVKPIVQPAEIDAVSPMFELGPEPSRARIEVVDRDRRFAPGVARHLLVRIENLGQTTWRAGLQRRGLHLSYHWWTPDVMPVTWDGVRTVLPIDIQPGESVLVEMTVTPPSAPGDYLLDIDLLQEGVRWFDCAARVQVPVAERMHLSATDDA